MRRRRRAVRQARPPRVYSASAHEPVPLEEPTHTPALVRPQPQRTGRDVDAACERAVTTVGRRRPGAGGAMMVAATERGDVPLDKSIDLYAEGDRLRAQCQKRLDAARAKIDQIRVRADGTADGTRPFDD